MFAAPLPSLHKKQTLPVIIALYHQSATQYLTNSSRFFTFHFRSRVSPLMEKFSFAGSLTGRDPFPDSSTSCPVIYERRTLRHHLPTHQAKRNRGTRTLSDGAIERPPIIISVIVANFCATKAPTMLQTLCCPQPLNQLRVGFFSPRKRAGIFESHQPPPPQSVRLLDTSKKKCYRIPYESLCKIDHHKKHVLLLLPINKEFNPPPPSQRISFSVVQDCTFIWFPGIFFLAYAVKMFGGEFWCVRLRCNSYDTHPMCA